MCQGSAPAKAIILLILILVRFLVLLDFLLLFSTWSALNYPARCSCALPGELRGKRELLSRSRDGHLPVKAAIRDPVGAAIREEGDYVSITSVDGSLEEVGVGEYR